MATPVTTLPEGLREDGSLGNGIYVGARFQELDIGCEQADVAPSTSLGDCTAYFPDSVYIGDKNGFVYIGIKENENSIPSRYFRVGPEDGIAYLTDSSQDGQTAHVLDHPAGQHDETIIRAIDHWLSKGRESAYGPKAFTNAVRLIRDQQTAPMVRARLLDMLYRLKGEQQLWGIKDVDLEALLAGLATELVRDPSLDSETRCFLVSRNTHIPYEAISDVDRDSAYFSIVTDETVSAASRVYRARYNRAFADEMTQETVTTRLLATTDKRDESYPDLLAEEADLDSMTLFELAHLAVESVDPNNRAQGIRIFRNALNDSNENFENRLRAARALRENGETEGVTETLLTLLDKPQVPDQVFINIYDFISGLPIDRALIKQARLKWARFGADPLRKEEDRLYLMEIYMDRALLNPEDFKESYHEAVSSLLLLGRDNPVSLERRVKALSKLPHPNLDESERCACVEACLEIGMNRRPEDTNREIFSRLDALSLAFLLGDGINPSEVADKILEEINQIEGRFLTGSEEVQREAYASFRNHCSLIFIVSEDTNLRKKALDRFTGYGGEIVSMKNNIEDTASLTAQKKIERLQELHDKAWFWQTNPINQAIADLSRQPVEEPQSEPKLKSFMTVRVRRD